jgi:hypothetical protein
MTYGVVLSFTAVASLLIATWRVAAHVSAEHLRSLTVSRQWLRQHQAAD